MSICREAMEKVRGYFGVALVQPKTNYNVGAVLRAVQCFGGAFVVSSGRRYERGATDVLNTSKHIPLYSGVDDVFNHLPFDCEPVAVDLVPDAIALDGFVHKERAFYIFGPEDGTLGKAITDRCARKIVIPSHFCLNLAAAVNVVLYDRTAKQLRSKRKIDVEDIAA